MMKMTNTLFIMSIGSPSQPIVPNVQSRANASGNNVAAANSMAPTDK